MKETYSFREGLEQGSLPDSKRLENKGNHAGCRIPFRLAAACIALLTLFLGACRIDTAMEFKTDGSAHTEVIFEDDGAMKELKSSCNDLKSLLPATHRFLAQGKLEDITPPGGYLTCKVTSDAMSERIKFTENATSYSITSKAFTEKKEDYETISATTKITMPGKVIKSTVGTIKGNTVIIKDLNYAVNGFMIVAEKDGSGRTSGASHSSSGRPQASSMNGSSDLPVWAWVSIAVGGIVCVLGIIAIARAGKRRNTGAPGQQLYGGPGQDTGPWRPPYQQ